MTDNLLSPQWHDLVGMAGVGAVLFSYFRLQIGRWDPSRPSFALTNMLGAAGILLSLMNDFNLSAFVVELAWLLISLIGLIRYFLRR